MMRVFERSSHRRIGARAALVLALATLGAPSPASASRGETCLGDLDASGVVDFTDLLALLAVWGPCPGCPEDLDGNGAVEFEDLLILLAAWGPCPTGEIMPLELAGRSLGEYPHFDFVRAFNEGSGLQPVEIAIDPGDLPEAGGGLTADVYVVAARDAAEWEGNTLLSDVRGSAQEITFDGANIQANTFTLDGSAGLSGDAGLGLGVGYDLVCDFNQNGRLDGGDLIDGLGDEDGFAIVHDVTRPGPLAVTELTYQVPNWDGPSGFAGENLFFPTDIGTMGQLPLIVMSHGNGHNYQWYNHLGTHMASYGYILMSHANNTGPGVFNASTTTLQHTDRFLTELESIGGGVLVGHVDASRIVWLGHSRGGEGVVIAYDRIFDGAWTPVQYDLDDIKLVSSIAPTDFRTQAQTDPHHVAFHLWTAAGDADVNGCASCNLCQTFHLHDRAEQYRQSISLYGVGHGNFHNGGGNQWFTGPCPIGTANTHAIMRGHLLPLVKHYIEGNAAARDFLTRQWEEFQPIGAPTDPCVVVNLMYRAGDAAGKFVIDDYQSEPGPGTSSSGGSVTFDVANIAEGRLDDSTSSFTTATGLMNGMTVGGPGDDTAGVVFEWNTESFYELGIITGARDFSDDAYLSFRACQETRHPFTTSGQDADTTFTVTLRDTSGTTSDINIAAYGGGVEEPYQRTGCGTGIGWANDFETVRIDLRAYLHNASGLDLTSIEAVRFNFGGDWGTAKGRLGLDDVEIIAE